MESWLLYPLIVFAIGCGWWLGRRERAGSETVAASYYNGINYLLNEQPDRAVSSFIQDLEVSPETLETHLALGSLLRRKGDLEQAVVVHENILQCRALRIETLEAVQLELARDYLLAGLLDRAESLVVKLQNAVNPVTRRNSLRIALEIYEREKEWRQAIEVAERLAHGPDGEAMEATISHYYCELAEEALARNAIEDARQLISKAIGHDAGNARASLIQGQLEFNEGRFEEAIRVLQRIPVQDPVYVPESLALLRQAYDCSEQGTAALETYLLTGLQKVPAISLVLMLAELIREREGDEAVTQVIADHLKQNPTVRGLTQLIDLHMVNSKGAARENLSILRSFAEALVADKPAYRCGECGFEGRKLHWHCPGCKGWGTIRPIFGLEGE